MRARGEKGREKERERIRGLKAEVGEEVGVGVGGAPSPSAPATGNSNSNLLEALVPEQENEDIISVIKQLTDPEKIDYTTEINNPYVTSLLYILGDEINREYGETSILQIVDLLKLHMIPYKRKRTAEILKAISAESPSLDEGEILKRALFGSQSAKEGSAVKR